MQEGSHNFFTCGNHVQLQVKGVIVGAGEVFKVQPEDTCHFVSLGIGRVSVIVKEAFEGGAKLPYPYDGVETIEQCIGSLTIWDIDNLLHVHQSLMEEVTIGSIDVEHSKTPSKPNHLENLMSDSKSLFSCGDYVHLQYKGVLVAGGEVFKIGPFDTCHSIFLGNNRISVLVKEAFDGKAELPYPHNDVWTIEDSIGSYTLWDVANAYSLDTLTKHDKVRLNEGVTNNIPCDEDTFESQEGTHRDHVDLEDDEEFDVEGETIQNAVDFNDRSKWYLMGVELWTDDHSTLLARGPITLSQSTNSLNNDILGDDHVGVLIMDLLCDNATCLKVFPNFMKGCPYLIKWPIHSLKVSDGGPFLGGNVEEEDEHFTNFGEDADGHDMLEWMEKKRAYNFFKRKPADPKKKKMMETQKKCNRFVTEDAINSVCNAVCCIKECCRFMDRQDIADSRVEFHGLKTAEKATYILSHFRNREISTIDAGQMVLKNHVICKMAFWKIYGFSKSKFYAYQEQYEAGAKVGFHGNKGTKKPYSNTMMARAFLNHILVNAGEPMPHLQYNGGAGTSNIQYKLPSCYDREEIYNEMSQNMKIAGIIEISKSSFYKIWKENFDNFSFHKKSAFAKCEICTTLKEQLMKERRTEQHNRLEKARARHMHEQMSRRNLYYANRVLAQKDPEKYLCIIHDKMDQAKTGIPKMITTLKSMASGCMPLPIALTGMLTHGRLPGVFAHYSIIGLWPSDADFTITSIAKCLRDLESYDGDKSGDISIDLQKAKYPFFRAILDRTAFEDGFLKPKNISINKYKGESSLENVGLGSQLRQNTQSGGSSDLGNCKNFIPLPRHLTLQMDNSSKDNKNQFVMAFCSELVMRGIFETVQMSFLMVGHTHEDIDAFFSKVSTRIFNREVATFPALMAEVWESEEVHPVPGLIQEVANYKAYVSPFMKSIVGQSRPVAFLFSMRNNKPIYQVRDNINDPWTPSQGRCIWEVDTSKVGHLNLPSGEPKLKTSVEVHKKVKEIVPYIKHYVEWLKKTWNDHTSEGYSQRFPLIKYWEAISDLIQRPLMEEERLQQLSTTFWPRTNHGTGYKEDYGPFEQDTSIMNTDIEELERELRDEIEEREEIFVGAPSERENSRFVPLEDIQNGRFIILRPTDEFERKTPGRFWVARAIGPVQRDPQIPHYGEFQLQWWRPKQRKRSIQDNERYEDCFSSNKVWECDPCYNLRHEHWMNANASMFFWSTRAKKVPTSIRIPETVLDIVRNYISRIEENDAS